MPPESRPNLSPLFAPDYPVSVCTSTYIHPDTYMAEQGQAQLSFQPMPHHIDIRFYARHGSVRKTRIN